MVKMPSIKKVESVEHEEWDKGNLWNNYLKLFFIIIIVRDEINILKWQIKSFTCFTGFWELAGWNNLLDSF